MWNFLAGNRKIPGGSAGRWHVIGHVAHRRPTTSTARTESRCKNPRSEGGAAGPNNQKCPLSCIIAKIACLTTDVGCLQYDGDSPAREGIEGTVVCVCDTYRKYREDAALHFIARRKVRRVNKSISSLNRVHEALESQRIMHAAQIAIPPSPRARESPTPLPMLNPFPANAKLVVSYVQ